MLLRAGVRQSRRKLSGTILPRASRSYVLGLAPGGAHHIPWGFSTIPGDNEPAHIYPPRNSPRSRWWGGWAVARVVPYVKDSIISMAGAKTVMDRPTMARNA